MKAGSPLAANLDVEAAPGGLRAFYRRLVRLKPETIPLSKCRMIRDNSPRAIFQSLSPRRQQIALVLWSAVTPRSIESQDLDRGRRFITEDLVLDLRPCEAPLASRSIRRSRLSSCLYRSDCVERRVGAIVPAKDDL